MNCLCRVSFLEKKKKNLLRNGNEALLAAKSKLLRRVGADIKLEFTEAGLVHVDVLAGPGGIIREGGVGEVAVRGGPSLVAGAVGAGVWRAAAEAVGGGVCRGACQQGQRREQYHSSHQLGKR